MNLSNMSVPAGLQALTVNVNGGEVKNNNNKAPMILAPTGDANANQLAPADEYGEGGGQVTGEPGDSPSPLPPLVSSDTQDKLLIWGTEEQCLDQELHNFELVECQEIHTFLREGEEDEEDGGSIRGGRDDGQMSISSISTSSSASVQTRKDRNDNDSNGMNRGMERERRMSHRSSQDLDSATTSSGEGIDRGYGGSGGGKERERGKGGLKSRCLSENNMFVSCLSTVSTMSGSLASALDSAGVLDLNQNSPPPHQQYQEPHDPEVQPHHHSLAQKQEERSHHGNGVTSEGGLGQRRKGGFEERVPPPRRQQLVRPLCQTETGRGQSLEEPMTDACQTGQYSFPSTDTGHRANGRHTHTHSHEPSEVNSNSYPISHFHYSSSSNPGGPQSRQPSQAAQREARSLGRQPAGRTSSPSNPSSLERRPQSQISNHRPYSSPNRAGAPHSPLRTPQGSPRKQPPMYPPSRNVSGGVRQPQVSSQGYGSSGLRPPVKTNISTTGIPKPPFHSQKNPPNPSSSERSPPPNCPPKPKGVRPKIITYIRKSPQVKPQAADGPYQVSSLPSRLSAYTHTQTQSPSPHTHTSREAPKARVGDHRNNPVLSASNLLYDKYRQEMLKSRLFPSGLLGTGIRAPSHAHTHTVPPAHTHTAVHPHPHTHSQTAPPKLGSKAESFYGPLIDKYLPTEMGRSAGSLGRGSGCEDSSGPKMAAQAGGSGSLLRSNRGLRPQLGLGAVSRTTSGSAKGRMPSQSQRSTQAFSHPVQAVSPETNQSCQDNTGEDQSRLPSGQAEAPRSLLPKPGQSGLRTPGFCSTRLPPARLAAFGFVRSSSVSSADSAHSDSCRPIHRPSLSEDPPLHRVATPPADHQRGGPCRSSSLQPPSTPALPRRYLPAQPRGSPVAGRKEFQRSSEVTRSLPSSPKRLAVVPPKPQSPVHSKQRPAAAVRGSVPSGSPKRVAPFRPQQEQQENLQREKKEAQRQEREREVQERENEKEAQKAEVQRLQGRCEQQERQLRALRDELRKTTLCLEAFIITTQQYCLKTESSVEKEKDLSLELQNIRDEVAFNSVQWERLRREKTALEMGFEQELRELQLQQEAELAAVEEGLRNFHSAEAEHLRAEHQSVVEELRAQQQEQVEELTVNHQASIQDLRDMHNITMATLHEEHARTMRDLRKAHEQQKMTLEENFEKLRLSLQDQVDTLMFQNHGLRDKAKRFEEALRRSTDEQIVDALAPYQHIQEDLKSLKEVVEMKNQQIHQQEKKISDLEIVAHKNVFLEEKVQVLQQQNEDLMARIDNNLALSRQLSEENANLHGCVEKESTEKKRLSRNNDELLWRLQTSPLMSPCSSPIHRSFSTSPIPSSPFFSSSPGQGNDSPSQCWGSPLPITPTHCPSPSHRAATNQNYPPGPATPPHRASTNQNHSPGPATPPHRASANHCQSPARLNSLPR